MNTGDLDPERKAKLELGSEIRRLRKAAGLTQHTLGRRVGYSRVYITNVETGRDLPGEELVRLVGLELEASATLDRLYTAVVEAHRAGRTSALAAELVETSSPLNLIPRPDGSDMVLVQAKNLDGEWILVNINRREALRRLGAAAALASITPGVKLLDQAAPTSPGLITPVEHLRIMQKTLIDADNIFGSAHALPGTNEQLNVIERLFDGTRGADRRALLQLRAQFAESMAWLSQDQADYESAWYWSDRALEWSHLAGDPALTSIVLARKSQLAGDRGAGPTALDYAQAAIDLSPAGTRLPAMAQLCVAHGHALAGERDESAIAYDLARHLVVTTEIDPELSWGAWLDEAYIDVQEARSLTVLGRHTQATSAFDRALDTLPEGYPRDRGVYLARAAHAHASAGDAEQAAALGVEALKTGQLMRSGRIDRELRSLLEGFQSIDTEPVSEFRELAHTAHLI